jgi:hypothetical protein
LSRFDSLLQEFTPNILRVHPGYFNSLDYPISYTKYTFDYKMNIKEKWEDDNFGAYENTGNLLKLYIENVI